jgi:hypothetical protein
MTCSARETKCMMKELEMYFESKVEVPLMRHGERQRLETLIKEEALLLAKYLRDEKTNWAPRISYTTAKEMMNR